MRSIVCSFLCLKILFIRLRLLGVGQMFLNGRIVRQVLQCFLKNRDRSISILRQARKLTLVAIDIVEIGVHGEIGPELLDAQILQRCLSEPGHVRKGDARFAGNLGRVKQNQFVNRARGERRSVQ